MTTTTPIAIQRASMNRDGSVLASLARARRAQTAKTGLSWAGRGSLGHSPRAAPHHQPPEDDDDEADWDPEDQHEPARQRFGLAHAREAGPDGEHRLLVVVRV